MDEPNLYAAVGEISGEMTTAGYRPISVAARRQLDSERILDIGFKGAQGENPLPIVPWAIGVDLDYPGYDGVHLPFPDSSQDVIFSSHCLEHIEDYCTALRDWYRVLRTGGVLILLVPHQHLYERKAAPPSRFTGDHKRFYTPKSLLEEVERALPVGGWRLRLLRDVDQGFDYSVEPERHARGLFEIELILEKIERPPYADALVESPIAQLAVEHFASLVGIGLKALREGQSTEVVEVQAALRGMPLPPYRRLAQALANFRLEGRELTAFLSPVVAEADFDEAWYIENYPDIGEAVARGVQLSGHYHFIHYGYFEGRLPGPLKPPFQ